MIQGMINSAGNYLTNPDGIVIDNPEAIGLFEGLWNSFCAWFSEIGVFSWRVLEQVSIGACAVTCTICIVVYAFCKDKKSLKMPLILFMVMLVVLGVGTFIG